jgi:transitional endoplasmic reticulum ATPase
MAMNDKPREISLKVQEANPNYVGKIIVTLDSETKRYLGVSNGDIVDIEGKKKTAAMVWPASPQDEGKGIIRMDPLLRQNTGTAIGDTVKVRPAKFAPADKIILAPTQQVKIIASGYDKMLKRTYLGKPMTKGDNVFVQVFGSGFVYVVVDTFPKGVVQVTDSTKIVLKEEPVKGVSAEKRIAYEDIGGIGNAVKKIREMIELPLRHPELFRKLGIDPPKGVLLHGPPGTGKTLLAKAVANETNAHFISINGPSIMSKFVGEAEERLRQIFKEAEENSPSIIFIDEIDAIAPKRSEVVGEVERRVVAQLLALMDGMESRGNVIVIAATNRPNAVDEALRRPGRFDREIEIGVPDKNGRLEILQIHTRGMPLNKDVDLKELANITHGFVGADLEALAKESAMKALRRYLPRINLEEEKIPPEVLEDLEVVRNDFYEALKEVQPSALREVTVEVPNIKWEDIGALDDVKKELQQAVEWPLKNPDTFVKMGITPPKGILMYGPPGTGKTLLAKAVATESEANFISVKGPELLSKWVGESEKAVREVFRKARQTAPTILFFDEIDALAPRRGLGDSNVTERVVNQFLTEMDGIEALKQVIVIAATNRPDMVDPALMRPGRFDKLIRIPSPDEKARKEILKIHTKKVPLAKSVSIDDLAALTEGYSGADLEGVVREAALIAMLESKMKPIPLELKHFEQAMIKIRPSISKEVNSIYETFKPTVTTEKEQQKYIG